MRYVIASLLIAPTLALVAPTPARACGGFFCNAVSQTPIIQAGERVLFARHDGRVTMHIEVVYQGEPTEFGWIVPVPEAPTDAAGKPLPLDKAVSLSSVALFPRLQAATDPIFRTQSRSEVGSSCQFPNSTATTLYDTTSGVQDAASSADSFTPPPVVVLQEAEVGPYNAQLIHAEDADALYAWLNLNGYLQDPAARPVLDHYVTGGFEFIGIRLKSGKSTGDLRPLAISLGENAPCVPLRLTAIAATPDMPILVWVLGDGRAVPKNFIHARLNDLAFQFPGGGDYQGLISRAIDSASGRAWVTEFAGPTDPWRDSFALSPALRTAVASATTASELVALLPLGTPDIDNVVRDTIAKPTNLRGYPYGSCYYCTGCNNDFCPDEDAAHITTDAEFYNFLDYWVGRADDIGLVVDVPLVAARLESDVFKPLMAIDELFAATTTMTRFYTMLDPSEMTRDPVFAFNPDLPMVSNDHVIDTVVRADADCNQFVDVTYADGRTWRVLCSGFGCTTIIGPVPGEDPLLHAEVLDESGPPIVIGESQVTEVDRLLDGASVGLPTLPPSFVAHPPKRPRSPAKPSVEASGGCASGDAPALPIGLAFVVLIVGLERRRRAARPTSERWRC